MAALLVSKMPPAQAEAVAERLIGVPLSRCTLDREAHRQGVRAQQLRAESSARLDSWEKLQEEAARQNQSPAQQPFTLVIEIDAWNIRERDHWGQTEDQRARGQEPERWHWVYTATCFRLDHRGSTAAQRPIISQRGYVSTRLGVDALFHQLQGEAVDRGLWQAAQVLVIADGALWIWNGVKDRFPQARQRLDLFHLNQHPLPNPLVRVPSNPPPVSTSAASNAPASSGPWPATKPSYALKPSGATNAGVTSSPMHA